MTSPTAGLIAELLTHVAVSEDELCEHACDFGLYVDREALPKRGGETIVWECGNERCSLIRLHSGLLRLFRRCDLPKPPVQRVAYTENDAKTTVAVLEDLSRAEAQVQGVLAHYSQRDPRVELEAALRAFEDRWCGGVWGAWLVNLRVRLSSRSVKAGQAWIRAVDTCSSLPYDHERYPEFFRRAALAALTVIEAEVGLRNVEYELIGAATQ